MGEWSIHELHERCNRLFPEGCQGRCRMEPELHYDIVLEEQEMDSTTEDPNWPFAKHDSPVDYDGWGFGDHGGLLPSGQEFMDPDQMGGFMDPW